MSETFETRCLVIGGGPAGMMLGFLLARAGIGVAVLEKHGDFNRDFRGDTIHPSTLELMHELGLLDEFLKLPHQEVQQLGGSINGTFVPIADFSRFPTRCKFIALMPQWDFLNFLSAKAKRFPSFQLRMQTEVTELLTEDRDQKSEGRIVGVRAKTPHGELIGRADLVVGADGRHSIVRERAGLPLREFGVPIDVLWMRISKGADDPAQTLGFFDHGKLLVLLDRADYWQVGFVIPKGGYEQIKGGGLAAFHQELLAIVPFLRERVGELDDWSKIKLLTVQINRLTEWCREGLLCIGDAAHAMSPAGGVGINLAIQDAVATANLLGEKMKEEGKITKADLRRVQERREWPTRLIQTMQVLVHRRITGKRTSGKAKRPLLVRLLRAFPFLRQFPARFVGMGPRPEHIEIMKAGG